MFITARQLEDLHKSEGGNGHVTLPYRARLTPLAADFVRARKLVLGYAEVSAPTGGTTARISSAAGSASQDAGADARQTVHGAGPAPIAPSSVSPGLPYVWWCDGPCGPAKAAVVAEEKQAALRASNIKAHPTQIVSVVKALAADVKSAKVVGGVLLVQSAAQAIVYANRCPSLRAVLGACLESVEQGITQVAANVLIVEYPHKTLPQIRNMLSRFLRAPRTLSDEVKRQIEEFAKCG
ncbi:MAG TPA: hypothetical protein VG326_02785 [Tepidisphaeraceae bacterium]|nr:hypothetical protein [Tepidisphaeraceae bacterium]